ncbi:MAG: ribonuclease HI [Anaerolineales bacterium]|jgi:ribonuclease HI
MNSGAKSWSGVELQQLRKITTGEYYIHLFKYKKAHWFLMAKKKIYVVVHGRVPGLFVNWFGKGGAQEQIDEFPGAIYKGFYSREEAIQWLRGYDPERLRYYAPGLMDMINNDTPEQDIENPEDIIQTGKVLIFTDGGAISNPGHGGYGVVIRGKGYRKELSGGFRETTNNRMEILACIEGLRALKGKSEVVLYSDSKYVVDSMMQGWVRRWKANGWRRDKKNSAENVDLWNQLLELTDQHEVEFRWLRGHAGHDDNERCDTLAKQAAMRDNLPPDVGYENLELRNPLPLFPPSE